MPPKAGKEVQETLPTLKALYINFSLAVSDKTLEIFISHFESLISQHAEFIEVITKSRLKLIASEKGLIFDPDSLNEKQKKDPKFMQSIQNAPTEMSSEIYFKCYQSLVQDIIAQKSDPKLLALKQASKKEIKKDSKGNAQSQEEQSKNPLHGFDLAFMTINFPQNTEELGYFIENQQLIPQLFCYTKQNTIIKESPNFLDTLSQTKQHLENDLTVDLDRDFAIMEGDKPQNLNQLNQFLQIEQTVQNLKDFRSSQVQIKFQPVQSELRNLVLLQNELIIYDDQQDQARIHNLSQQHLQNVFNFLQKLHQFTTVLPTIPIKKLPKMQQHSSLIYQRKQLQQVPNIGVGIYLETLLDEVCNGEGEDLQQQEIQNNVQMQHITVCQHVDMIQQAAAHSKLQNGDLVVERVKLLQKGIQLPGINRYMMPKAKDINLRKSKQQQIERLISQDLENFTHRKNLVIFEKLLKQFQPKRNWDLKNRIFDEKLNSDCLKQALNESFLLDSHTITHYDEDYDRLYLIIVFKNPPGRILRRQWFYEDKIMPNLQYFYKMKDINENTTYYDEDCLKLGNIQEKTKYLFPNDMSLIIQKKLQYGETQIHSNVFFNSSHSMGIDQNPLPSIWMSLVESKCRLLIEQANGQVSSTLTLTNGLLLKFLHNGDILQQFERIPNVMKRTFQDIVSPYDDLQGVGGVEISRIVTKDGNVVKSMKDGKKIIFGVNGNIIVKQNQLMIITNNKGQRFKKRIGQETLEQAETIGTQMHFDIETCKIYFIGFKFQNLKSLSELTEQPLFNILINHK